MITTRTMPRIVSFILFVSIFLFLYGLLHYYFYWSLKRAFILSTGTNLLVVIVLLFLCLLPILMNLTADIDNKFIITTLAYIGYVWMAVLFLFFSIHLLIDLYSLFLRFFSKISNTSLITFVPSQMIVFLSTIALIILIILYGFFEAENIKVEREQIKTSKLSEGMSRFRVVQISDIHFSSINGLRLAKKIEKIIKNMEPDILVSTGDLIERGLRDDDKVIDVLKKINTTYGKFAVTGNHEFYTGIKKSTKFTEKAGFKMLRDKGVILNGFVNIVGVDDPARNRMGEAGNIQENILLGGFPKTNLTILLKHQPKLDGSNPYNFDLQLSGHTHKGQIFPFSLIVSIFYPYNSGLHQVGEDSYLYVTRGTGTWGPPVRFLSPPEITVIDFVPF